MQKSHFKKYASLAGIGLGLFFMIILWINLCLAGFKPIIVKQMENTFHKKIRLQGLSYHFPNKFVLNNLSIFQTEENQEPFMTSQFCTFKFSIMKILFNRKYVFKEFVIQNSEFEPYALYKFIYDDLLNYFRHFKRNNLDIKIEQARYRWSKNLDPWELQTHIVLRRDMVKSSGMIQKVHEQVKNFSSNKNTLTYFDLKGGIVEKGFTLDELIVNHNDYRSKFWGYSVADMLWLNGYSMKIKQSNDLAQFVNQFHQSMSLKNSNNRNKNPAVEDVNKSQVYLSDMGILAQFDKSNINITKLFADFNGIPIVVAGNISLKNHRYDLTIDADWEKNKQYVGKIMKVAADVKGTFEESTIKNNAEVKLIWRKNEKKDSQLSQINLNVKDFKINFQMLPQCFFAFKEGKILVQHSPADFHISLRKTEGYMNIARNQLIQGRIQMRLYNGMLSAQLENLLTDPSKMTARLRLKNIKLDELSKNIFHIKGLNGLLNSELIIQHGQTLNAAGGVQLANVHLTDRQQIKKIINYLQLPADQDMSVKEASSKISFDGKNVKLTELELNMTDVKLNGSLVFKENVTVESEISLYLTKKFIQNSRYLRPTLPFLNKQDLIQFDFRVSGYATSPNIEWVDTEAKTQIQSHIPNFVERILENRIQQSYDKTSVN